MAEIVRSCASLSWIDPKTGLPEVDEGGHPGVATRRAVILGEEAYRFSNFLEAAITVEEGRITNTRFTAASGMYRSPSYMGMSSEPVGKIGRFKRVDGARVVFRQVVGCRTAAAEKIGARAGGGVGVGGGIYAGAKIGMFLGPKGAVVGGVLGGLVGGVTGWFVGEEAGEFAKSFPPIWSEIELVIHSDGRSDENLIAQSLFPSCTFYRQSETDKERYEIVGNYDAVPALDRWNTHGWNDAAREGQRSGSTSGNPWNMVSGAKRFGGHKVNRPCPTGYSCD